MLCFLEYDLALDRLKTFEREASKINFLPQFIITNTIFPDNNIFLIVFIYHLILNNKVYYKFT